MLFTPTHSINPISSRTDNLSLIALALTPVMSCNLLIVQFFTIELRVLAFINKEKAIAFLKAELRYILLIMFLLTFIVIKAKATRLCTYLIASYLMRYLKRALNPVRHQTMYTFRMMVIDDLYLSRHKINKKPSILKHLCKNL